MQNMSRRLTACAALVVALSPQAARAETGAAAWLRYERVDDAAVRAEYEAAAGPMLALGDSPVLSSALEELVRGVTSMLDRRLETTPRISDARIVLGTADAVRRALPKVAIPELRAPGSFWLAELKFGATRRLTVVAGKDDRGVLHGVFALLRRIALREPLDGLDDHQEPATPIRWTNEWDNLDGSIERGYAGASIFFDRNGVADDLTRVREYARLLASVGINGCAVNNVNANPLVITREFVP